MNTYIEDTQEAREVEAEHEEPIVRSIEKKKRTAKLPSNLFLWGAGAAMLASLALEVMGMLRTGKRAGLRRPEGHKTSQPLAGFVGMWVPSLLLLGVYDKIVKIARSDRTEA